MALIALIGGSGLDHWGGDGSSHEVDTPFGPPSGPVSQHAVGRHELLFLPRHGPDHTIAPHRVNYRANIHALRVRGADAVIAVNAVGSLVKDMAPGVLAVPDQLIDYTSGRESSFFDGLAEPLDHVDFTEPFDAGWRTRLVEAAAAAGEVLHPGGCIGVTQGPRLETAAEIERLRRDGCRLVGMTTMPEAALAREARLPYVCLAVVANLAAGMVSTPIRMETIENTLADAMTRARSVIDTVLERT